MLKNMGSIQPNSQVTPSTGGINKGISSKDGELFKGLLEKEVSKDLKDLGQTKPALAQTEGLKFSTHAIERIQSRGIKLTPDDMKKLNDAVDKAIQKGSKDTLVLMGENAFVVSAKNKTVITAMDKNQMKENVFTNIDSTVFMG
ncbi:MAG: TIGR02530 family flagellar biosynthesis protein [Bdellovibrionota bacterium]